MPDKCRLGAKQIANMLFHIFDKFDLIESAYVVPEKILGAVGACGTFLSPLHGAPKKWPQRVMEWVGGALCAIYGSELAANTLYHSLDKFDLIDSSYVVPEKILGLAGFLCGALGVTVIDWCISRIKQHGNL
ncbi:hypothetical protein [uncultured Bartonella sp.]|uniref:hypothetical protein n=1 Tax=uncultured Bartonella sp. TaxID=104108 RepID=UPI0026336BB2|nr:hypothetical protein [uncultured Bartonella sp.]